MKYLQSMDRLETYTNAVKQLHRSLFVKYSPKRFGELVVYKRMYYPRRPMEIIDVPVSVSPRELVRYLRSKSAKHYDLSWIDKLEQQQLNPTVTPGRRWKLRQALLEEADRYYYDTK